jgi:hypothetical protein
VLVHEGCDLVPGGLEPQESIFKLDGKCHMSNGIKGVNGSNAFDVLTESENSIQDKAAIPAIDVAHSGNNVFVPKSIGTLEV